jgi:hypothetical protein
MAYKVNHYVPQFVLKNFCDEDDNKINLMDLIHFEVKHKSVKSTFSINNFYDLKAEVSQDPKKLEKLFGEKIESKMGLIIKKVNESPESFEITRKELEVIKKYITLQRYRNPSNQSSYNESFKGNKLSKYSIKKGESEVDFWKREMLFILENDWDTIIKQTEFIGVKMVTDQIYSEYITFFTTNEEFIITDVNCFTERINMHIPENKKQEYYEMSLKTRKMYNMYDAAEGAQKEVNRDKQYFDNYTFVVVSPNLAIASINQVWKHKYLHPEISDNWMTKNIFSPILNNTKNFSLPVTNYVNREFMKDDSDIGQFKDKNDKYLYKKILLNTEETNHIMVLCLNEARLYIGYKTSEYIKKFILAYKEVNNMKIENIRNNFNGFISLIDNLDKNANNSI